MLVAFGVILLMGIIVSDHLSAVRKSEPADLSGMAPMAASRVTSEEATRVQPLPGPGELSTVNQPQEPQNASGLNPGATAVKPGQIAAGPAPTAPVDTFIIQKVNAPTTGTSVIDRPGINLDSDTGAGAPAAPAEKIHTVAKGDSLSSISKQYYNDPNQYKRIADANKLTKNSQLKLGMKLTIPAAPAAKAAAPVAAPTAAPATPAGPETRPSNQSATAVAETPAPAAKEMSYTVKQGDTLSTIAAKTLGSKNKWTVILDANKATLKDPKDLKIGMVLKVPRGNAI